MESFLLAVKKKPRVPTFVKLPNTNIAEIVNSVYPGTTSFSVADQWLGSPIGHMAVTAVPSYYPVLLKYVGDGQFAPAIDGTNVRQLYSVVHAGNDIFYNVAAKTPNEYQMFKKSGDGDDVAAKVTINPVRLNYGTGPMVYYGGEYFMRSANAGSTPLSRTTDFQTFTYSYASMNDAVIPTSINTLDGQTFFEVFNGVSNYKTIISKGLTAKILLNKVDSDYNSNIVPATIADSEYVYFFQGSGWVHQIDKDGVLKSFKNNTSSYNAAYSLHSTFLRDGTLYIAGLTWMNTFKNGVFSDVPYPSWIKFLRSIFSYRGKLIAVVSDQSDKWEVCELVL